MIGRSRFLVLICLATVMILFSSLCTFASRENESRDLMKARVIQVLDGDTVKVQLDKGSMETVRYLLIDTPETHHPKRGKEEMGIEASLANRELAGRKRVYLELDVQERDKYGRLLAYVWLDQDRERMINEELVKRGFAMPLTIPPNIRYVDRIHKALGIARSEKRGLWGRAEKRIFSPAQVWSELPYLRGCFITLKMKVHRVIDRGERKILLAEKGRFSIIIYKSDLNKFLFLAPWTGKELKLVGKVLAGYHGAEMILKDPFQILNFGTTNPSTSP